MRIFGNTVRWAGQGMEDIDVEVVDIPEPVQVGMFVRTAQSESAFEEKWIGVVIDEAGEEDGTVADADSRNHGP